MNVDELIMEFRRLVRHKRTVTVTLVRLSLSGYIMASPARFHYFRNGIDEVAATGSCALHLLDHGDVCLIDRGDPPEVAGAVRDLLASEEEALKNAGGPDALLASFRLPAQYAELREHLELVAKVEAARVRRKADEAEAAANAPPQADTPAGDGSSGSGEPPPPLEGTLTLPMLARIEDMLDGIDLAPFVQRQTIYSVGKQITPLYREHITSVLDLRAQLFPAVEIDTDAPLYYELCRHLDRLTLVNLLLQRPFDQQRIGINLGHGAPGSEEFARLRQRLNDRQRANIVVELHWMDALRDIASGGRMLAGLREGGFGIAIDRLSIDLLLHLDLRGIECDYIKLTFDKTKLPLLMQPERLTAMRALGLSKLILTACDDQSAITFGRQMGLRHFQGWLIDRYGRESERPASSAA